MGPTPFHQKISVCDSIRRNFAALAGISIALGSCAVAQAAGLAEEAYVWQREWNGAVQKSVREHGNALSNVVVLAAEVTWQKSTPKIVRVPLPSDALRDLKHPPGLALRVGPYHGAYSDHDAVAGMLVGLAADLIKSNAPVSELQIDFDCASSKLNGYRQWVIALKRAVAPTPLIITVLPDWLNRAEFPALAQAAGGYVLQVHSLERPKSFDAPFTLCDPAAAQSAVIRAGKIGVPFRVALPTYGYVLAFAKDGKFIGLSAEGPAQSWPAEAKLREVRADPLAMAELVEGWSRERPAAMTGIIWYRFPVESDILNWRWPTLNAMLEMRSPREHVRAESRRAESGLVEISLVNDGELDVSSRLAVTVHWQDARLEAGDALRGFELEEAGPLTARFRPVSPPRLRAGDTRTLGWLRLNKDAEVSLELSRP